MVSAALAGCVYFNSVYNANELFDRGVAEIEAGNAPTGRASLVQAIEKAEKVVRENPDSRWADDAQRLIAEARVLLEDWEEARGASRALLEMVSTVEDSAEASGLLGIAEAHLEESATADTLLTWALEHSNDQRNRARFHYSRGLARLDLGSRELAEVDFRQALKHRPSWMAPRLKLTRSLAAAGRTDEAAWELMALFDTDFDRIDEEELALTVEALAAADPAAAQTALGRVEKTRLSRFVRARLVKVRGDVNRGIGRIETAVADYRLTVEIASDSRWAAEAYLERIRLRLAQATSLAELDAARTILREARSLPYGSRLVELQRLSDTLGRLEFYVERGKLGYLAAAEDARDLLGAPGLARHLYLRYVEEEPEGLWAPKAILAALDLMEEDSVGTNGDHPDPAELRRRLVEDYGDSAYVQVLLGGADVEGFSYEELEEGLRVQLNRLRVQADIAVSGQRRSAVRP